MDSMSKPQVQRNCSTCKKKGTTLVNGKPVPARPGQWTCKQCHAEYQLRIDRAKRAALPIVSPWCALDAQLLTHLHEFLKQNSEKLVGDSDLELTAADGSVLRFYVEKKQLLLSAWNEPPAKGFTSSCGYSGSCMSKPKVQNTIRLILDPNRPQIVQRKARTVDKTFLTPAETATMNLFREKTAAGKTLHLHPPKKAKLTTSARRKSSGAAERDRRPWRAEWDRAAQRTARVPAGRPDLVKLAIGANYNWGKGPCKHVAANATFRRVLETRTKNGAVRRRLECTQCGNRWSEFSGAQPRAEQLPLDLAS